MDAVFRPEPASRGFFWRKEFRWVRVAGARPAACGDPKAAWRRTHVYDAVIRTQEPYHGPARLKHCGGIKVALLLAGLCGPALSLGAAGSSPPEPVLAAICYHRFGLETGKDPYRISLARLAGQLEWLRANGCRGVSLTQVAAALDGDPLGLPPKAVLLSVDDGYKAGALGAAVFERYGFHAVYFVVTAMLG